MSRYRPLVTTALAVLSGLVSASAVSGLSSRWFLWIGLVPLLMAVDLARSNRSAFFSAFMGGSVFGVVALWPLVSANEWTGWAVMTATELAKARSDRWWFLNGLMVLLAMWGGGLFWGGFAIGLRWLEARGRQLRVVTAPALWILGNEWLRSYVTWSFSWSFLGNGTADFVGVRQLAALGGVWLLSAMVVAVNVVVHDLMTGRDSRRRALAAGGVLLAVILAGHLRARSGEWDDSGLRVVAIQVHKAAYVPRDFIRLGLDRSYLLRMEEALLSKPDLLVLPETISFGAVSLDGTHAPTAADKPHSSLEEWNLLMARLLGQKGSTVVLGLDTTEHAESFNSMVAWNRSGVLGWYHKRRLVPFGEYQPSLFRRFGSRGKSQYSPGRDAGILRSGDMAIGSFICQEVLFPAALRESVLAGANVLVSGGNDGVFSNPRIALIHADQAQIRAVETGRYIVRAMRTGITAVIDPTGREIARSRSSEASVVSAHFKLLTNQTPYVRLGSWPVPLAAMILAFACRRRLAIGRRSNAVVRHRG